MHPTDQRTLHPARTLLHPGWLLALGLLVLNDHLLKHAGVFPGVLTGKLSDVVGLIVAPALLATLLRVRGRAALLWVHLAIGAVFAAINLSPAAAHAFEGLMALGPLPWAITVDPSDLLTLPALLISWRLIHAASAAPARALRRPLTHAALGAGLLASMATSPPPEPFLGFPTVEASLMLGATDDQTLLLRIRPLADTTYLDCREVAPSPTTVLSRALFAPAVTWLVEPGRAVQVHGEGFNAPLGACFAALVDGTLTRGAGANARAEPIPMTLVFWTTNDFPARALSTETARVPNARLLRVERAGDDLRLAAHPAVFPAPPLIPATPAPGCEPAPAEAHLAWESPLPVGQHTLLAVASARDGCHRLTLGDGDAELRWTVCTNTPALPFDPGDGLFITAVTQGQRFHPVAGAQLLGTGSGEGKRVVLAVGADLAPWGSGDWAATERAGCAPTHDACGNYIIPLALSLRGPTGVEVASLPGGSGQAAVGAGTLLVHRAERVPVGDATCTSEAIGPEGHSLDSVFITPPLSTPDPPNAED